MRRAAIALSFSALVLAPAFGAGADEELIDGIAAQVGGDVVLSSEIDQMLAPLEPQARAQGATDQDLMRLRAELLDRLVERRMIAIAAKRMELDATDAEIDDAIAAIAKDNQLTVEQLRESVAKTGMPYPLYREKIRGEIVQAKVLNGVVRARTRVDEAEVRRLYDEKYATLPEGGEQVHIRHLLVSIGEASKRTEAQAREKAKAALATIRGGTPFEKEAARISESSPERGGDIGWVPLAEMPSWMADTVRRLEPGQVSDVICQPFGCNLIQLVERRSFTKKPYDEVRSDLRAALMEEKMGGEYEKFMKKLREQTYVDRRGDVAIATRSSAPPAVGAAPAAGAKTPAAKPAAKSSGGGRGAFEE